MIPFCFANLTLENVSKSSWIFSCGFVQVTGFSVGGRVVDGNGMGVEGVKIIVDDHKRSVTDRQGHFKLDQVLSLLCSRLQFVFGIS